MKKHIVFVFFAGLANLVMANDAAVGTVTHLKGTFSVQRTDKVNRVLSVKSEVREGDLLSTEADTFARIMFVDGGEVVLCPNTQFKVEKYNFNDADASQDDVHFSLLKGGLRAVTGLIGKRSRDKIEYLTSVARIGAHGTNHGMLLCNNDCDEILTATGTPLPNGLHLDVAKGAIEVSNHAGTQLVGTGQFSFVVSPDSPPILVPTGQGVQVTLPQSVADNNAHGHSTGRAKQDIFFIF